MKIVNESIVTYGPLLTVVKATYIGDYVLRIFFSDHTSKVLDLKAFLENSKHLKIKKYLDENQLKLFQITDGNLIWGDYELIFPLEDLYKGGVK